MKDLNELLEKIKLIMGNEYDSTLYSDEFILFCLQKAILAINNKRQYTATDDSLLELKYIPLALELAIIYINKQGAEGETIHSELGVIRHYRTEESILNGVIPLVYLEK